MRVLCISASELLVSCALPSVDKTSLSSAEHRWAVEVAEEGSSRNIGLCLFLPGQGCLNVANMLAKLRRDPYKLTMQSSWDEETVGRLGWRLGYPVCRGCCELGP